MKKYKVLFADLDGTLIEAIRLESAKILRY